MPLRKTDKGWFWGLQGPFPTKAKAVSVAQAAYANGFKESEMQYTPADFVQCLFHAVTNAHILHLQTKSYAVHVALGSYYNDLNELTDSYAEAYQGKYGIIEGYTTEYELPSAPLEYIILMNDYIKIARQELPQDSELQNIIDEIVALHDSTIYKLRFLG